MGKELMRKVVVVIINLVVLIPVEVEANGKDSRPSGGYNAEKLFYNCLKENSGVYEENRELKSIGLFIDCVTSSFSCCKILFATSEEKKLYPEIQKVILYCITHTNVNKIGYAGCIYGWYIGIIARKV